MKLSIITINYNNLSGLKKTLESVASQVIDPRLLRSGDRIEYIVVDGASTDGSAEVITKFADRFTLIKESIAFSWISEKDSGIYNAMNKGVRRAKSDYVLMLNSGDFLVDQYVISRILPELDGTDIIQGNTIEDGERNRGYGRSNVDFLDVQRGHFLHQASFCKRDLFDRFGFFDETYRYVSDTKFFIKTLGYGGASFRYVDIDIADFDLTGFSCSANPNIRKQHKEEERRLQRELFPGRLYDYCRDSERKVELYDKLRSHKLLWKLVVAVLYLEKKIHG